MSALKYFRHEFDSKIVVPAVEVDAETSEWAETEIKKVMSSMVSSNPAASSNSGADTGSNNNSDTKAGAEAGNNTPTSKPSDVK